MSAGSEGDNEGGAGAPEGRDPWAPPAEDAKAPGRGPGAAGGSASVHDQWTVTSMPGAYPPPVQGPGPHAAPPVGNPFAAPGEPVPPPPISPDGPGRMPYGYEYGYGHGYGYPGPPGGAPGYGYPGQPGYPGYQGAPGAPGYGWPALPMAPANGMGVTALVLGIIAAVGFCLWPLAIVVGILAVIFGAVGRGKVRRGEATNGGQALAGIICGAAGVVLSVAVLVILLVVPDEDTDAARSEAPTVTASSTMGP
ncbi:DUF4190 domain-containing protein [Streptomyces sp. NPDC005865]|uniref:DUF4190 domain-containing protein n=1 Tax=Streptomyces sp. NPDC005865 TaxID=3155453 RepID=UPI0033F177F8